MGITIDGKRATLYSPEKPSIHQAGLVFLGAEFEEVVPPLTLKVQGRKNVLRGFSDDEDLFEIYDRFAKALQVPERFDELEKNPALIYDDNQS